MPELTCAAFSWHRVAAGTESDTKSVVAPMCQNCLPGGTPPCAAQLLSVQNVSVLGNVRTLKTISTQPYLAVHLATTPLK